MVMYEECDTRYTSALDMIYLWSVVKQAWCVGLKIPQNKEKS